MIEEFGGWQLYQELLQTLQKVATRHTAMGGLDIRRVTSISMVAIQYILNQEQVKGVIIGSHDSK